MPFSKQASDTCGINFFGTLRVLKALMPLLRPHGRVVNVVSMAGISALSQLAPQLKARIRSEARAFPAPPCRRRAPFESSPTTDPPMCTNDVHQ